MDETDQRRRPPCSVLPLRGTAAAAATTDGSTAVGEHVIRLVEFAVVRTSTPERTLVEEARQLIEPLLRAVVRIAPDVPVGRLDGEDGLPSLYFVAVCVLAAAADLTRGFTHFDRLTSPFLGPSEVDGYASFPAESGDDELGTPAEVQLVGRSFRRGRPRRGTQTDRTDADRAGGSDQRSSVDCAGVSRVRVAVLIFFWCHGLTPRSAHRPVGDMNSVRSNIHNRILL